MAGTETGIIPRGVGEDLDSEGLCSSNGGMSWQLVLSSMDAGALSAMYKYDMLFLVYLQAQS